MLHLSLDFLQSTHLYLKLTDYFFPPQFIHLSYISLWHKFYETMDRSSTGLYVQLLTNIYKLNSKIFQIKFTYKLHLNLMAGLFHFLKPRIYNINDP